MLQNGEKMDLVQLENRKIMSMKFAVLTYKPYQVYIPKFYGVFSSEKEANQFGLERKKLFGEEFDVAVILPIDSDVNSQQEVKDTVSSKKNKSFFRKIFKGLE